MRGQNECTCLSRDGHLTPALAIAPLAESLHGGWWHSPHFSIHFVCQLRPYDAASPIEWRMPGVGGHRVHMDHAYRGLARNTGISCEAPCGAKQTPK